MKYFDRSKMEFYPLSSRNSKVLITESALQPGSAPPPLEEVYQHKMDQIAREIMKARRNDRPVMLTFGAHAIKNGLSLLLAALIEENWVTHLATNGAGVIHDWEFAFQGLSSEDVRVNVDKGTFGTWEETGFTLNLALAAGAFRGWGYGESIGAMISSGEIIIPSEEELYSLLRGEKNSGELWQRAAAADFLDLILAENLKPGPLIIKHPFAEYSIQARAFDAGVPFTSHPMFGHDIIYTHRTNRGAVIGRCAERDFLCFAESVSRLEGGVYLSVGSAVMSPMIFEKSLSMARNIARRDGRVIKNCPLHVVDIQEQSWDWSRGEPPIDNPAYYHRFMKTFNRMGCPADYTCMDNRVFLHHLYKRLHK
ncbi:MAG: hypothetical protein PF479_15270 [Oceanispirochaeta sp.]|nr:hypothetical protein [Oceanispirochaeta sp.]